MFASNATLSREPYTDYYYSQPDRLHNEESPLVAVYTVSDHHSVFAQGV